MPIEVGALAPDFVLRDQNNQEVTLSAFRGQKAVLLVFYPLAFTGICTGELCAVRDDLSTFQNDDVQVITVSVDSPYSHKIFAEREGYRFPLLSDFWPHGAVAQQYGVFNEAAGIANRGTFLIDRDGVVRFAEMNEPGQGRDAQRWREAIKEVTG
ncbi:MAG: peroxiredoxin [Nocardioides sp.]|nr:peroxiredoxin [Nocardioides sp.]